MKNYQKEEIDWDLILSSDMQKVFFSEGFKESKKSTKKHRVYEKGDDLLKVTVNNKGHYLFLDLKNDDNRGNIYQFYTKFKGLEPKEAILKLKGFYPEAFSLEKGKKVNRAAITEKKEGVVPPLAVIDLKEYAKKNINKFRTFPAKSYDSFLEHRDIDPNIVGLEESNVKFYYRTIDLKPRFGYAFPIENNGNVIGVAIKDVNFSNKTYMVEDSLKEYGYWSTKTNSKHYFITEDPNDALAHKQLFNEKGYRHFATLGRFAPAQVKAIHQEYKRNKGISISLGFDNDGAGINLAKEFAIEWLKNEQGFTKELERVESLKYHRKENVFLINSTGEEFKNDVIGRKKVMEYLTTCFPPSTGLNLQVSRQKDWNDELTFVASKKKGYDIDKNIYLIKNYLIDGKIDIDSVHGNINKLKTIDNDLTDRKAYSVLLSEIKKYQKQTKKPQAKKGIENKSGMKL